ncbi:hypothetical protein JCM10207_003120 [Rhodosporidiobolus poonsookiae]
MPLALSQPATAPGLLSYADLLSALASLPAAASSSYLAPVPLVALRGALSSFAQSIVRSIPDESVWVSLALVSRPSATGGGGGQGGRTYQRVVLNCVRAVTEGMQFQRVTVAADVEAHREGCERMLAAAHRAVSALPSAVRTARLRALFSPSPSDALPLPADTPLSPTCAAAEAFGRLSVGSPRMGVAGAGREGDGRWW